MDWNPFTLSLATFCGTALGWWVAHYLSSRRDIANERRKLIVSYLLDAYRKLEGASNRNDLKPYWSNFESAIADVQLLGSTHQVGLARQFSLGMAKNRTAPLDELIFDLRQSLRAELKLEPVPETVVYLRFSDRP